MNDSAASCLRPGCPWTPGESGYCCGWCAQAHDEGEPPGYAHSSYCEAETTKKPSAAPVRLYGDCPEWEKALRAIVLAGELGCPSDGLALVARKALADCGVPYEEQPV